MTTNDGDSESEEYYRLSISVSGNDCIARHCLAPSFPVRFDLHMTWLGLIPSEPYWIDAKMNLCWSFFSLFMEFGDVVRFFFSFLSVLENFFGPQGKLLPFYCPYILCTINIFWNCKTSRDRLTPLWRETHLLWKHCGHIWFLLQFTQKLEFTLQILQHQQQCNVKGWEFHNGEMITMFILGF